jgi:hypothetical protein
VIDEVAAFLARKLIALVEVDPALEDAANFGWLARSIVDHRVVDRP